MKGNDLTGKTFNRLLVIRPIGFDSTNHCRTWLCTCECSGAEVIARSTDIKNGHVKSCGCLKKEKAAQLCKSRATHGNTVNGTQSPEYTAYVNAKQRCENPNVRGYKFYGARGIKFIFGSFEDFISEVGTRPSPKHSLDRVNNDGHYEKGNLRWSTHSVQQRNRRSWDRKAARKAHSTSARKAA